MTTTILFDDGAHKNVLLEGYEEGTSVPCNQHLIVDSGEAMILDPGGHKVYSKVLAETTAQVGNGKLRYIFLSHQDPDIVAAVNGWLMTTDAVAYSSQLWTRFIPHFGLDRLVADRLLPIGDEGTVLELGGCKLPIVPAHFLHSCGNFQVYDPRAKILYTGDLGASVGVDYLAVTDFDSHVDKIEGFHRRYMACNAAMRAWAKMVRPLDIDIIAPQHGAHFKGKETVARFIDWCESLECGADLLAPRFAIPEA